MRKNYLALLLVFCMVFSMFSGMSAPVASAMETADWDGVTTTQPSGEGTEASPFQIGSPDEMAWFAGQVSTSNYSQWATLTDDVDMGTTYNWQPMATGTTAYAGYSGTFDGQGHTLTLNVATPVNYAALFKAVGSSGVVKNLTVAGEIKGTSYASSIVGYNNYGTVLNCKNTASISNNTNGTTNYLGGLVAVNYGRVQGCINAGNVAAENTAATATTAYVGGIAGQLYYNAGAVNGKNEIIDCYNVGSVSATTTSTNTYVKVAVGGIAGAFGTAPAAAGIYITNCYSNGELSKTVSDVVKTQAIGGILGLGKADTANPNKKDNVIFTNCWYESGKGADTAYNSCTMMSAAVPSEAVPCCTPTDVGSKTADELKALTETLGSAYKDDFSTPINGGYPILTWEQESESGGGGGVTPPPAPTVYTVTKDSNQAGTDAEEVTEGESYTGHISDYDASANDYVVNFTVDGGEQQTVTADSNGEFVISGDLTTGNIVITITVTPVTPEIVTISAEVSPNSVTVNGSSASADLTLSVDHAVSAAGFSFTLELPEGITVADNGIVVTGMSGVSYNAGTGKAMCFNPLAENITVSDTLATITLDVNTSASNTYTLKAKDLVLAVYDEDFTSTEVATSPDSVTADLTVTVASVPTVYTVTKDSHQASTDAAQVAEGESYTGHISDYDASANNYVVNYTVDGGTQQTATADSNGAFVISGDKITGNVIITITVTPIPVIPVYTVTKDSHQVSTDAAQATEGESYTGHISDYDASANDYVVNYTVDGGTQQTVTADSNGAFVISGDKITGNIVITITVTAKLDPNPDGVYEISNAAELMAFAELTQAKDFDGDARLTADIILGEVDDWDPLGYKTASSTGGYKGTFNGDGHSISLDATCPSGAYAGLFDNLAPEGVIKNLTLNGFITGSYMYAGGFVAYNYGTIQQCVNNAVITITNSGSAYVGGIAGNTYYGLIENCVNHGAIFLTQTGTLGGAEYVGGIAGQAGFKTGTTNTIQKCYNTGNITVNAPNNQTYFKTAVGGILGYFASISSDKLNVKNCYNIGTMNIESGLSTAYQGGVIGYAGYNPSSSGTPVKKADIVNCWYLEGTAEVVLNDISTLLINTPTNSGSKSADWLKAASFIDAETGDIEGYKPDNTTPINNGYPILEWQVISGQEGTGGEDPTPSTPDNYSVDFIVDGETVKTATVVDGDKVAAIDMPADPEKSGYTFKGWQKDGEGEPMSADEILETTVTAAVTYTAVFEENEPTPEVVTISASVSPSSVTVEGSAASATLTLAVDNKVSAAGFSFTLELPDGITVAENGISVTGMSGVSYNADTGKAMCYNMSAENIDISDILATITLNVAPAASNTYTLKAKDFALIAYDEAFSPIAIATSQDSATANLAVTVNEVPTLYDVTLNNSDSEGIVVTGISTGKYSGSVTFTVASDNACAVFTGTGDDLTVISAEPTEEAGVYSYTIDVSEATTLSIYYKGDADCNGELSASDANAVISYTKGLTELSPLAQILCDVDGNQGIGLMDVDKIIKGIYGISAIAW